MTLLDVVDPSPPAPDFPRDRWGRPLIIPPGGGKPIAYFRASSYGGPLEDRYNLEQWRLRTASVGLSRRQDLIAAIAACAPHEKKKMDEHVEAAIVAGGGSDAANIGVALHSFSERVDRGELAVGDIPEPWRERVQAYVDTIDANGLDVVPHLIECRLVNDRWRVAGTADRFYRRRSDGRLVVADLKTGKSVGSLTQMLQLFVYATSVLYDPATGERTPIGDVDTTHGLIIHLPAVAS